MGEMADALARDLERRNLYNEAKKERKKPWGSVRKRYLIKLIARKILKGQKRGGALGAWAEKEMKRRRWKQWSVESYARGEWRIFATNRSGRPTQRAILERQGMEMWKRRGLDDRD